MSDWYLYDDTGKIAENQYTEEGVREVLKNSGNENPTVYAMNEVGDLIETHDGPITVARQRD